MIQSVNKSEAFTVIKLRGTLEIGKQAKLKEDLLKQIYPGSSKVILDFKAVEFMYKVRKKMTKKYLTNREQYFAELEALSKQFLSNRSKAISAA